MDVIAIVVDHWSTLRRHPSNELSWMDVIVFGGAPIFLGALHFFYAEVAKDGKVDEVLVAAFSIFAALLLNVQVFLLGFKIEPDVSPPKASKEDQALRKKKSEMRALFYGELFSNISYAILVSIVVLAATLAAIFWGAENDKLFKSMQFAFVVHFILTLAMVMKRVHALFGSLRTR